MFSKINENIDQVFFPYFDNGDNKFRSFILILFLVQGRKELPNCFVDPKGVEHSEYMNKVEGLKIIYGKW